jgi:RNA polymerase sigma-70 factor (ECF subfamily)
MMKLYNKHTDNELVSLLKTGDEIAFSEIYSRYWKLLFQRAYAILRDDDAAKDAVQDVFISLWKRRKAVEIIYLKAYLQQAIRFKVLHFVREERTDSEFYFRLRKVTTEIIAGNPLLFKEQQNLLNELVDSLPEDCKEAFLLSREDNLTYKQIAEQLDVSIKTVEKRISKSLKYLRENIGMGYCLAILFFF